MLPEGPASPLSVLILSRVVIHRGPGMKQQWCWVISEAEFTFPCELECSCQSPEAPCRRPTAPEQPCCEEAQSHPPQESSEEDLGERDPNPSCSCPRFSNSDAVCSTWAPWARTFLQSPFPRQLSPRNRRDKDIAVCLKRLCFGVFCYMAIITRTQGPRRK